MSVTQSVKLVGRIRQAPKGLSRTAMRKYAVPAISLGFILLVILAVALADVLAPYGPLEQDLTRSLEPPSAAHWLGTDSVGRDILSRLLYGGRPALLGVALALIVFLIIGTALGVIAGYLGGWADRVVGVVVDLFMALPNIILILAVLAVFSQSQAAAMITFGILASANLIRIVRAAVISFRDELYVSAAVVSGLSDGRIMSRHILPGVVGPVLVQASILSGIALSVQTGLGFLGVADRPPHPSWGGMIGEASQALSSSGYFLLFSGGIVALMTFAFGFLGDGLRDLASDTRKQAAAGLFRRAKKSHRDVVLPETAGDELLTVVDYSVGFRVGDAMVETVRHLDWGVSPGEIVGLVGESGSGKSVTAVSLLGLLPANGEVTSGGAWLEGRLITGLAEKDYQQVRGSGIALVSQEPMVALDPSFTIGSQLEEVVRVHSQGKQGRAEAHARAVELLNRVRLRDVESLMRKLPHELSGGMIQRVVIAMALAGNPKLLIADEPTTALDVTVQAEILDLLRDLRDSTGMAIVIVTHDLGVVADVCDRVLIMSQGEIVERGDLDTIFYSPAEDYTRQLISSTPSLLERS